MLTQPLHFVVKPFKMPTISWLRQWLAILDARYFQLAFLISLLLFGALARDFSLTGWQVFLTLIASVGMQAFWQFWLKLPNRKKLAGLFKRLSNHL